MPSISAMDPTLRAAGIIGFWSTNVPTASSILDEGAAETMAGDATLAGRPISLEVALGRTHPEDRGWVFERIRRIRRSGGPFSTEFRILTGGGDVRWVLVQGQLTPDETGAMLGRGAYIDTTVHHTATFLPPRPSRPAAIDPCAIDPCAIDSGVIGSWPETDPLALAADRALTTHAAITRTGYPNLKRLSELMLFELGQILGRGRRA